MIYSLEERGIFVFMEGLKKIAADLQVERTKATNALRDRARLKVDNETLNQELKEKTM